MSERAARIHRSQEHKLAEFTVERCPKCSSDQMAIEPIMRGGTASDGQPLVWFRCASCRALAMTRAVERLCQCGYPETPCDKHKHDYGHDCVADSGKPADASASGAH